MPRQALLRMNIRIVKKNAERLKRVIDQLLDFRKIENNKMGIAGY